MTRNWNPSTRKVAEEIERKFFGGRQVCSTYPNHGRPGEPWSIDAWVAPYKQQANKEQEAVGDRIQKFVEVNWDRLGVDYIIWWNWWKQGRTAPWTSYEPFAFTWPFGDPDPDTRRHLDHVHISCKPGFTYRPPEKEDGDSQKPLPDKPPAPAAQIIDTFFKNHQLFGPYKPIGQAVVEEAKREGLNLALGCALVEKESAGRNVFGADGPHRGDVPPFNGYDNCRYEVTRERVERLINQPGYRRGQASVNGVGLTQLAWYTIVLEAEQLGGAHIPRNQLRVGFSHLASLMTRLQYQQALGAYNAGEGRWWIGVNNGYAGDLAAKHEAWKKRLAGSDSAPAPDPEPDKEPRLVLGSYHHPHSALAHLAASVLHERDMKCDVATGSRFVSVEQRCWDTPMGTYRFVVVGKQAFEKMPPAHRKHVLEAYDPTKSDYVGAVGNTLSETRDLLAGELNEISVGAGRHFRALARGAQIETAPQAPPPPLIPKPHDSPKPDKETPMQELEIATKDERQQMREEKRAERAERKERPTKVAAKRGAAEGVGLYVLAESLLPLLQDLPPEYAEYVPLVLLIAVFLLRTGEGRLLDE